ncbi:MAG: lasso peptide biosynthesis B2 protein [Lentisphaerae bacterium]|nr:lasso peptide biosynthesis B2 protein [Lentisphaerota bacterium]
MRALLKFFRLPFRRQILCLEAVARLATYRVAVLVLPFKRLWAWFGLTPVSNDEADPSACTDLAREIGWTVRACAPHVPWECKCLVKAVTGYAMLRRRGIRATVHMGLAKDEEAGLRAHAWLVCGNAGLIGSRESQNFTTISLFTSQEMKGLNRIP